MRSAEGPTLRCLSRPFPSLHRTLGAPRGLLGTYVLRDMTTVTGNKRETHFTDKFMASPVHTALPWHKSEVSETWWPQLTT